MVSATSSDSGSVAFDEAVENAYRYTSRHCRKKSIGDRLATSHSIAEYTPNCCRSRPPTTVTTYRKSDDEHAGAEREDGVEDDREHGERREPHHEVHDPHARVEHLLEQADHDVVVLSFGVAALTAMPKIEREDHQLQHFAVERADRGLDRIARDELDESVGERLDAAACV